MSLARLGEVVAESRVPIVVCSLPDLRVLLANGAAAELFCRPQDDILGRHASEIWAGGAVGMSETALSALGAGAVESFRARREIATPAGSVKVWIWGRAVELEEGRVGVGVVLTETEGRAAGRLIGDYFGMDAIDLAVGTIDPAWRVGTAAPGGEVPGNRSEADRFADLERQVLQIAAELHSVSLVRRDPSAVHESREPDLDHLSPRQREIVGRLLRGERIPTIAEAMYLSPSTVRNHLSNVFRRLGVNSQAELLARLRSRAPGP